MQTSRHGEETKRNLDKEIHRHVNNCLHPESIIFVLNTNLLVLAQYADYLLFNNELVLI